MPKPLRAVLLPLLAALALGAAACGDDVEKSNDYVDAVNRAQNSFAQTFDRLNAQITSTSSPKEDRATLERFRAAIDRVVGDLRRVEPPDKVKELHGELIGEISGYGKEIDKARKAFRAEDPSKVIAAQTDLVAAVEAVSTQINGTIERINKKLRE